MNNVFGAMVYIAFGFVFFVIFSGPTINLSDAWFWAWLFGWPLIIGIWILKWFLIVALVLFVIAGVIAWREGRGY